jgi:hypothetical protein
MRQWFLMSALISLPSCAVEVDLGCDDGALQCHQDALEFCMDGAWGVLEDCAAKDQICHEMGDLSHCMDDGMSMSTTM